MTPTLRHRPGCDPRERGAHTCPCGAADEYAEAVAAAADHAELRDHLDVRGLLR